MAERAVLITGTSTGIGRACTERMAAEGWRVYAGVRKEADGEAVQREVRGDVRPVLLDVTDLGQIDAVCEQVRSECGGLQGLVNNAGVAQGGAIETTTDEDWRWHFEVNVFGVIRLTRAAIPLLRSGGGRVVTIGSIAGRVASPMMAPYAAGKHAVEAISEALRFELADDGIAVACVEPGEIASAIWDKAEAQLVEAEAALDAEQLRRYDRHLDMLHGFVADGAKRGIAASKVADAVHHALTASRPRHRYLVGPDAKLVGVVSKLPDRVRAKALAANLTRWERSGAKLRRR